jgi:glutaredoxin-related protein
MVVHFSPSSSLFWLQERVKNLFLPQFVNGELVGGLDIMKELQENGDLADALK